jgi:hypothetical protein
MKTPMQELIDKLEYLQRTNPNKLFIEQGIHHGLKAAIKEAKSMLEMEKEQMIDFAYECRNVMAADEFAITHWYDKTFKTNEK